MTNEAPPSTSLLSLTGQIMVAYVSGNATPASSLPAMIGNIHAALKDIASGMSTSAQKTVAQAISVKQSVTPGYLICLEDGRRLKTLKRYLRTHYGLTPDEYRAKWQLPFDYPMVAPEYSARRSGLAKKNGLGRKRPRATKRKTRG